MFHQLKKNIICAAGREGEGEGLEEWGQRVFLKQRRGGRGSNERLPKVCLTECKEGEFWRRKMMVLQEEKMECEAFFVLKERTEVFSKVRKEEGEGGRGLHR